MKKKSFNYLTIFLLIITFSCSNEKETTQAEPKEVFNVGLTVKDISPLPAHLLLHTKNKASQVNFKNFTPKINESFIISYEEHSIKTI